MEAILAVWSGVGGFRRRYTFGGGQLLTFFFVNLTQWWGCPAFSVVSEAECSEPHFPAVISRRHGDPHMPHRVANLGHNIQVQTTNVWFSSASCSFRCVRKGKSQPSVLSSLRWTLDGEQPIWCTQRRGIRCGSSCAQRQLPHHVVVSWPVVFSSLWSVVRGRRGSGQGQSNYPHCMCSQKLRQGRSGLAASH